VSHNGVNPATFGFNYAQPPGDMNVNCFTPTALSSMGGMRVRQSTANSGLPLLIETLAPATLFSVAIDGTLNAGKSLNVNGATSSTNTALSLALAGEAVPRLAVLASGKMSWSDGTNAADAILSRGGANRLDLTDTELRGFRGSGSATLATAVTGDANRRWHARSDGSNWWGSGAATPDASISRSVVGVTSLKSDVNFRATGAFITAKNAAPADADIAAGELALWLDPTNGAAKFMAKAKQADGTVRTAAIALA
jgi:hypothetical protein